MSPSSENSSNATLRTYSRRVNTSLETKSSKKRRLAEIHPSLNITSGHSIKQSKVLSSNTLPASWSSKCYPQDTAIGEAHLNADAPPYPIQRSKYPELQKSLDSDAFEYDGGNVSSCISSARSASLKDVSPADSQPSLHKPTPLKGEKAYVDNQIFSESFRYKTERSQWLSTPCPAEVSLSPMTFDRLRQVDHHQVHMGRKGQSTSPSKRFPITNCPLKFGDEPQECVIPHETEKRRIKEGNHQSSPAVLPGSLPKKPRSLGIQSYFKPLDRSSSPPDTPSTLDSSDSTDSPEQVTPPSSPPSAEEPLSAHLKGPHRRPARRLTTRPILKPLETILSCGSSHSTNLDNEQSDLCYGIVGDGIDPTQPGMTEISSDEVRKGHSERSQMVSEGNRLNFIQCNPSLPSMPRMLKKRNSPAGYQQLQIDLGTNQSITCSHCNMVYSPSLPTDKRQHDDYCRTTTMPDLHRQTLSNDRAVFTKILHGVQHHIRVYGRTSPQARRAHARQVLDATYADLPGMKYNNDELASEVRDPLNPIDPGMVPRFKFYVYYIDRKVIGALLVERYHQSDTQQLVEPSRLRPSEGKHIILDRIWVAPNYRRMGFASLLVDSARTDFIPGFRLPKEAVAMPEQTAMGRGFAVHYFG